MCCTCLVVLFFTDLFVYQFSKTKIVIVANLMVALKILLVLCCRFLCDISWVCSEIRDNFWLWSVFTVLYAQVYVVHCTHTLHIQPAVLMTTLLIADDVLLLKHSFSQTTRTYCESSSPMTSQWRQSFIRYCNQLISIYLTYLFIWFDAMTAYKLTKPSLQQH